MAKGAANSDACHIWYAALLVNLASVLIACWNHHHLKLEYKGIFANDAKCRLKSKNSVYKYSFYFSTCICLTNQGNHRILLDSQNNKSVFEDFGKLGLVGRIL